VDVEEFTWRPEQQGPLRQLKNALVMPPAIMPLVYRQEEDGFVGRIVLRVDACGLGFGAIYNRRTEMARDIQCDMRVAYGPLLKLSMMP
jgi:hypothetical protein